MQKKKKKIPDPPKTGSMELVETQLIFFFGLNVKYCKMFPMLNQSDLITGPPDFFLQYLRLLRKADPF